MSAACGQTFLPGRSVTYNTVRPHKSLGYLTPEEYITQWRSQRAGKEVYGIP
jgi:transposase InsO family protein